MTASCSPIQMDVKRVAQIPVIGSIPIAHHRNAGTYDRLCSPLQSCSSSGSRYHRNLHQDEFGPTRAERMQALAGRSHHRSSELEIPCKFPANSLLFVENSLLGVQKFPAPLRREFGCKPMDSLAEWRRKLANEPKTFKN